MTGSGCWSGQAWADIKTEGAGREVGPSEGGQRPWVQEHILEQDTVPLSFLVPGCRATWKKALRSWEELRFLDLVSLGDSS